MYLFHQPPWMIGGLALFGRKRRGQPPRRQMRTIERLANIDVAKSRHYALVEQRGFQAGLLVVTGLRQHVGVEFVAEWFGTESGQQRLVVQFVPRDDLH